MKTIKEYINESTDIRRFPPLTFDYNGVESTCLAICTFVGPIDSNLSIGYDSYDGKTINSPTTAFAVDSHDKLIQMRATADKTTLNKFLQKKYRAGGCSLLNWGSYAYVGTRASGKGLTSTVQYVIIPVDELKDVFTDSNIKLKMNCGSTAMVAQRWREIKDTIINVTDDKGLY